MDFPFGPLAPDRGENSPGVLMTAEGCIPLDDGYGPFPALAVASGAGTLTDPPRGVYAYQTADDTWHTVVGQTETIELLASDYTFSSIDTSLSITSGRDWCFERYGDQLLYTNTTEGLRAYDAEAGGSASAISAAGDPEWIFECGNILFGLNCKDASGTRNTSLIRSCRRGAHTVWTGSGTDYQTLYNGGSLVWGGKLTDNSGLILQRREVTLLQVGNVGSAQWSLQSVSREFGSVGARSVVSFDGAVYWLATDGFRRFTLGNGIEHIGAGVIDQWFLSQVDESDLSLVQGTIDPFRKCVLWRYKSSSVGSTTTFENAIGYYWPKGVWFTLKVQTQALCYAAASAVTWDTFPGTWDAADITWDSRSLSGGQPLLGAINGSGKFAYFAGPNVKATFETSVANSPTTALISFADPVDDSADGTLALGVKNSLSDSTTWKTGAARVSSGRVPLRGRGKNIAFRRVIDAGSMWSYARGVDHVRAAAGGPR